VRRALIAAGLVLAMSAFAVGTYEAAAYLKALERLAALRAAPRS